MAEAAGAPPASTALLRGAILSARYEDEAALQAFNTAVQADPANITAALGIAEIRSRQDHVSEAVQWTERARQLSPQSPVVRAAYITALVRAGRLRRATDEAIQVTRDWPESADTYAQLGNVLAKAGQMRDAREAFAKALTIDARYAPAIRSLVSLDLADNLQAEARRRVEHALRLEPNRTTAAAARRRDGGSLGQRRPRGNSLDAHHQDRRHESRRLCRARPFVSRAAPSRGGARPVPAAGRARSRARVPDACRTYPRGLGPPRRVEAAV